MKMMTDNLPPILKDMDEEISKHVDTDLVPISAAAEWGEIVDDVILSLVEEDEYPEDVLKVTEYLICGWPSYEIAKKIGRKPETIRSWLSRYPKMALAVRKGQHELQRWRLAQLEKQFIDAAKLSQKIIEGDSSVMQTDSKKLGIQARQARYILGLFAGQKLDLQVKGSQDDRPTLKAEKDALDYLAERIAEEQDKRMIDVTPSEDKIVRVIDPRDGTKGPVLDEDGEPMHGTLGEIDRNDEGSLCHICGKRVGKLRLHVNKGHKMSDQEYEVIFMLPVGELVKDAKR
jgi:hypothetical protein